MGTRGLLDWYQATGDEQVFAAARAAYEAALPDTRDSATVYDYGFLLECHACNLLRQATAQYERAIELDPGWDKVRYQLMHAKAALGEPHEAIAEHRRRLAEAPHEVREHRLLAYALLVAHEYQQAAEVVAAGLRLAGEDRKLVEFRGDVRAGLADSEGALADWRRAVELDPTDIGPWYSSAYLLEREHRIGEAIGVWRQILDWNRVRDNAMDVEWATRELDRLHAQRAGDVGAPTAPVTRSWPTTKRDSRPRSSYCTCGPARSNAWCSTARASTRSSTSPHPAAEPLTASPEGVLPTDHPLAQAAVHAIHNGDIDGLRGLLDAHPNLPRSA